MKNIFKAAALLAAVLMLFCVTGCGDTAGGTPATPAEPTMQETPLTLEAIAAGTITLTNPWSTLKYKKNGGAFVNVTASANTISVAAGDKVALYADGSANTYDANTYEWTSFRIGCSADCFVYGNVMSLLSSANFKTAVAIPNTTECAFGELFYENTHIKNHAQKALVLPAITLAEGCYYNMFYGCTSLTDAPELPATTLADSCYSCMFYGCTSLSDAPALPATTLADECYKHMFSGCSSLNTVICLATGISAYDCTYYWLDDVASSGTFTKAASMTGWTRGESGIPSGWTVVDYTPSQQ